ncbi:MAG TPA: c-type cytochrome [Gemmatimonadaceae bacterium]|nr:c-type cytochrome [Gemmatimonadaceae bacterium]
MHSARNSPAPDLFRTVALLHALGLITGGCGGEKPPAASGSGAAPASATEQRRVPAIPVTNAPPAGATSQMVARGDSIFHGRAAGGLCYVCHGADANGTPLGPPLLEHQWITGSGSYQFIQQRVTEGMPAPTPPYLSPMPPMGGIKLSHDEIQAVSAYVYSISHTARSR